MLFEGAPIAPVQGGVITHVKGAGNDLAVALGEHEANVGGETSMQFVEEFLRQVLATIIKSVDMAFVETKHRAHVLLRQLRSFIRSNGDTALRHLTPFAFDLVAPVATKAGQIILE